MASTVGERIKDLRERKGLSQVELVTGLPLAPSYVSLIERGRRTPTRRVLEVVAGRLGCSADYLLTGRGGPGVEELELELRFAELALRSGDPQAARDRFARVERDAAEQRLEDVAQDAQWGVCRAEKALGNFEAVIEGLEALWAERDLKGTFSRVAVARTLAHTYLEVAEPVRATEVAEAGLAWCSGHQVVDTEERAELASTLVGCYYVRGEYTRAHLLAARTIEQAERARSAGARAAAYWNAGVVAQARGDLRTARRYTERALAIYGELDDSNAVARLRLNCAWLLLRTPDSDVAAAEDLLHQAIGELSVLGTPADVARAETELARCRLLMGDPDAAVALASNAVDRLSGGRRIESARARAVLARAQLAVGDRTAALATYTEAAADLQHAPGSHDAADAWRELGDDLLDLGMVDEAVAAYQHTADAAGIRRSPWHQLRPAAAAGARRQRSDPMLP